MTPVVAVLTDLSVLDELKPSAGEVDLIFDHPLEAILDPSLSASERLVAINSEQWPSDAEFYVSPPRAIAHTFPSPHLGRTEFHRQ